MRAKRVKTPEDHTGLKKEVLRKALTHACNLLEITPVEFEHLIGVKGASYSRFFGKAQDDYFIDPLSKNGEVAIMFLKIYQSLFAIHGGEIKSCSIWLRSMNKSLGHRPIELMYTAWGMASVLSYLERIKG